MLARAALAFLLCIVAGCAQAQSPGFADSVFLAPTERLRTFSIGRYIERTGGSALHAAVLREDLEQQGFYLEGTTVRWVDRNVSLTPVLGWDSNINGGLPNRTLDLPGITLVTTPEFAVKAGVVVGAALSGEWRLGYQPGRYFELELDLESVWSPKHEMTRSSGGVTLCARNHVAGWTFIDLCQDATVLDRELGRSSASETRVSGVRLFAAGAGFHEAGVTFARRVIDGEPQPALIGALSSVWPGFATRVTATLAAPIDDTLAQRRRVAVEVRRMAFGRPVYLELGAEEADGGMFLGQAREDRTIGAAISVPVGKVAWLQVGLADTRSSIPFFDEQRLGVSLRLNSPFWGADW